MNAFVCMKEEEVIPNGDLLDPCLYGVIRTVVRSRVIVEHCRLWP
jgi:hypothetical protein